MLAVAVIGSEDGESRARLVAALDVIPSVTFPRLLVAVASCGQWSLWLLARFIPLEGCQCSSVGRGGHRLGGWRESRAQLVASMSFRWFISLLALSVSMSFPR